MSKELVRGEILKTLEEFKPELEEHYKVREIGVFGSYIRGDQTEGSDIDILVDLENGATLFDLIGLEIFLEEKLGHKVDVVTKNGVREELRDEIFGEVVPV